MGIIVAPAGPITVEQMDAAIAAGASASVDR